MTLVEFPLVKIPNQPPEKYYGNKEYKIFLDSNKKHQNKATQMLFRINEGRGVAKYMIGITDCGQALGISKEKIFSSILNLKMIIKIINAKLEKIRFYIGSEGIIFVAHVHRKVENFSLDF